MPTAVLNVPDISCGHCERTITAALGKQDGVSAVAVDLTTRQVRVEYDGARVDVARLRELLEKEDYPVASVEP